MKKNKTFAIQIASSISIKNCKSSLKGNLLFYDSDELFYEIGEDQYVYIFKYGVLCFYNFDEASKEEFTKKILTYSKNIYENQHWEEVKIIIGGKTNKMTPDLIEISKFNIDSLRLIMLNVSQSVALDKYTEITEEILEDTNQHTLFLEEKGKLNIGGNKLKKFIGDKGWYRGQYLFVDNPWRRAFELQRSCCTSWREDFAKAKLRRCQTSIMKPVLVADNRKKL